MVEITPLTGRPTATLRRGWQLASGWYQSEERTAAWTLTAATFLLKLVQIAIQLRLNVWNRDFFNALERRDTAAFTAEMWVFLAIVTCFMAAAVAQLWSRQMLALRWRRWLVHDLQDRWMAACPWRLSQLPDGADNPDQRISENTRWATFLAVEFAVGLLQSVLTVITFAGILWTLSDAVTIAGLEIPGSMVFAAFLYAGAGSALTWWLGRPLVRLNNDRNRAESDHRFTLLRVRESAEAVALSGGGAAEARLMRRDFTSVLGTMRDLLRTERHLTWIIAGYAMIAGALPLALASPRYFAGAITLGTLMQLAQAFGEVTHALAWCQENWPKLAEWRSHVERVVALRDSLDRTAALGAGSGLARQAADRMALDRVTLRAADGSVLLCDATLSLAPGERVLVRGESGVGKTMLVRALTGLWPWGHGRIDLPEEGVMVLPQRPYMPLGTLRDALSYPAAPGAFDEATLRAALLRCGLPELADRLDEPVRWDRVLSLGAQQRLGFARLLLHRPRWVVLDEATSGLDEASQAALLALLDEELAEAAVLSTGNRPGLEGFHARVLRLETSPKGSVLRDMAPPPLPAPGRTRIAHAHAVPERRPAARLPAVALSLAR